MYNFNDPACGPQGCTPDTSTDCGYPALGSLPGYTDCNGKTKFTIYDHMCGLCDDGKGLDILQYALEENEFAPISYYGFKFNAARQVQGVNGIMQFIGAHLSYYDHSILEGGKQDAQGVYFGEMKSTTLEAKITAVTSPTVIIVDNAKKFAVQDTIRIYSGGVDCCLDEITAIVSAVDYATNTITLTSAVSVDVGDRVVFLWNNIKACDFPANHTYDPDVVEFRKAYWQAFGNSFQITFEQAMNCLPGGIKDENGNQGYVRALYRDAVQKTLYALSGAQWFGINVPETASQTSVTMGIIPTIQYYKNNFGVDNIHNLSGIRTDLQKVVAMKKIFDNALKNKRKGQGDQKLIVHCTEKMYDNLMLLGPAWDRLKNCLRMCTSEVVTFEIRQYKSTYGTIEFYVNQYLNRHYAGASMGVYVPDGHVYWVKPRSSGREHGGDAGPMVAGPVMGVKLEEVKHLREGKGERCPYFYTYQFLLAQVVRGVAHGAVGIVEGI